MNTFGNRLKQLRQEAGLTGTELGNKFGLTKSAISSYECRFREPSQDLLKQLAELFDVSVDYLLGNSDVRKVDKEQNNTKNEVHSFTVRLVQQLLDDGVISDPNNIPEEIIDMIIASLKTDLKKKDTK